MSNEMSKTNKISFTDVALPKGGGSIKGIGETFNANIFSGTGSFSVPIYTTPCRGFEPKISLDYNSASGSGVFGMGFSISIPNVSRKTDKGIPKYDCSDSFILSKEEELVPKLLEDSTEIEQKPAKIDGVSWNVTSYLPRREEDFEKIEFWESSEGSFWKVTNRENVTSFFGENDNARIADPEDSNRIFQWLLDKTVDEKGNKIEYSYKEENSENTPNEIYEKNHEYKANKYLSNIRYGNYYDENLKEAWAFEVVFDYGEYNIEEENLKRPGTNPYNTVNKWAARLTPFSSYRSGFEIRTLRLCRNILMFHHFEKELGTIPCLVRATKFQYEDAVEASPMLSKIEVMGLLRKDNGSYDIEYLPPLDFTYSPFDPKQGSFQELWLEDGGTIPGYMNKAQYAFVDLYGEGIEGLLYSDDSTTFYMKPKGEGKYAYPKPPAEFPIEKDLTKNTYTLTSLDGNGKLDLMVNTSGRKGFYEVNSDGTWNSYHGFKFNPLDLSNSSAELVDLDGDGCSELLVLDANELKYYPSLKKDGFGSPERACIKVELEQAFPTLNNSSKDEVLAFVDMFGDGLSHRVRIRNGMVECWPNLGYGRFGKRIIFGNAPRFDDRLDPSRLFVADIDGSGTTDIAYVYPDRVEVFVNKGGNCFEDSISIPLPAMYDGLSQITFADINGNGCTALVFSTISTDQKHFYYDFTGGEKPYLLTKVDNNMGAVTCLGYESSVKFYLEDEEFGKPWKTTLPFPVHLLERIESIDSISGSKLVTRYKYHEGYYDYVDKEFRGFGYVEQWDTEEFGMYSSSGLLENLSFNAGDSETHVPPVYTKRWYHTGAYIEEGILSKQYCEEYYEGDINAYLMPDSVFDPAIKKNDGETMRQVHRALAGELLRVEIYGLDNMTNLVDHPYSVEEVAFQIRQLQPRGNNKNAVLYVHERETIHYQYERNPQDPRIQHSFILEVDGFGNEKKVCEVFYPRRQPQYNEQTILKAAAKVNSFINETENCSVLGVPYEMKNYEIGGLDLRGRSYFSFEELEVQLNVALYNTIDHEQSFVPGEIQGRLLSLQRNYFWDEQQQACLPLGEITSLALLHHIESAEFTSQAITKVFGSKLTEDMLQQGGYIHQEDYWWNRGSVQHYYSASDNKFFLPYKIENTFVPKTSSLYIKNTLEYDPYSIAAVKEVKYLTGDIKNSEEVLIDYITLLPKQLTDINGNISEVLFDSLGRVKVISNHGMINGAPQGDSALKDYCGIDNGSFEDVTTNPYKYLQKASAFFYYDTFAWREKSEPTGFISLTRETYESDLQLGEESNIQFQINYIDGFGRNIENKTKVDAGEAILWDDHGNVSKGYAANRWLVSGRTVYNNKAKPLKQYEPYFSSIYTFEGEKAVDPMLTPPTVLNYDPLLRVMRVDTAKGFFSKVEFTPWEERYFDVADTIKDSNYYKNFMANYPKNPNQQQQDEKDALSKAELYYDTPEIKLRDNVGNVFLQIQQSSKDDKLITWNELDIEGRLLTSIDPRLYSSNIMNDTAYYNFKYQYSMSGKVLAIDSSDGGVKKTLSNIYGNVVHEWDSRGFHVSTVYDAFQRIIEIDVDGDDGSGTVLNQSVEKLVYGEYSGNNTGNLRGQVYQQYDQGGLVTFKSYNIKGQPLEITRQLRSDYKNEVNWNVISAVAMESETFTTYYTYDALGRVTSEKTNDGSVRTPQYNQAGLLNKVEVNYKEGTSHTFVQDIQYNANGQRNTIFYGNGVTTAYTYEDTTHNLVNILSTRIGGSQLQSLTYTYDPVGNITRFRDSSYSTVFNNQQVVQPLSDYTYDALYRLAIASGRQHPGINADTHKYEFKQCGFTAFSTPNVNDIQKLENYRETYSYDASGNLTTIRHLASSSSWTRRMDIAQDSNHMVKISSIDGITNFYNTNYDGNGNMRTLENLQNITWNYRDNICRADVILRDGSTSDSEYYVYDNLGNRIRKVVERVISSTVTEIEEKIYLGNLEIKRIKRKIGTTVTTILDRQSLHIMDGEKRIAIVNLWLKDDTNREVDTIGVRKYRYQLGNHLGSASMELDEQANIISYEEYYPFGGTAIIAGNSQREVSIKDYRYCGKERDDTTGLYYYGARYYAPWLGRWLSPDPAGIIDGLNLYVYVGNNPVTFYDYKGYVRTDGQNEDTSEDTDSEPKFEHSCCGGSKHSGINAGENPSKELHGSGSNPQVGEEYKANHESVGDSYHPYPTREIELPRERSFMNRAAELKKKLVGKKYQTGNFAYANVTIEGLDKTEYCAHSALKGDTRTGDYKDFSFQPKTIHYPATIASDAVGNQYLRDADTEFKIINHIKIDLVEAGLDSDVSGKVKMITEKDTCESCNKIIKRFSEDHRNLKLKIIHNNGKAVHTVN